jgi:hypothetical protein
MISPIGAPVGLFPLYQTDPSGIRDRSTVPVAVPGVSNAQNAAGIVPNQCKT